MKTKDTIVFNNKITLNPILATRAWFWHVASHTKINNNQIIFLYFKKNANFCFSMFGRHVAGLDLKGHILLNSLLSIKHK